VGDRDPDELDALGQVGRNDVAGRGGVAADGGDRRVVDGDAAAVGLGGGACGVGADEVALDRVPHHAVPTQPDGIAGEVVDDQAADGAVAGRDLQPGVGEADDGIAVQFDQQHRVVADGQGVGRGAGL